MKKTYFLCDLTSQQLFNLEKRIKNGKYHAIQLFDKKYYTDSKYIEYDIMLFNTREMIEYLKFNLIDIKHNGFNMTNNIFINRYFVKVWY